MVPGVGTGTTITDVDAVRLQNALDTSVAVITKDPALENVGV